MGIPIEIPLWRGISGFVPVRMMGKVCYVMYKRRTDKLVQILRDMGAQGAIIHKPSNMRWLSGYTGEGLLVIADGLRAVVTDFRYIEQAGQQAKDYTAHMITPGVSHDKAAAPLVSEKGISVLAFEDDEVTVKGMEALRAAMPGIKFVPIGGAPEKLRAVKDAGEIELIEKACEISCAAFEHIIGFIKPGVTELEVRFELENAMYRAGAEQLAFDTIVAAGANGALPHAIPGNRVIQAGDMVTMDYGAKYGGYCADMTRTVAVGKLADEHRRVYDTVLKAQLRAMELLKPGTACKAVDKAARDLIDEAGYTGRFGHGLGHSLGLDIHENPRCSMTSEAVLEPGIVMTNEPGIYLPGTCGCRIEDTVIITEDGCRRLTPATKELLIL